MSIRGGRLLAYLLLAGNWYSASYGWIDNPMVPLWSISIEEQFYLLWPAVAMRCSRRTMLWICAGLLVVANAVLYHLGAVHASLDDRVWCNSFVQFQFFAAGILAAILLRQRLPDFRWWLRVLLVAAWPALWFCAVYFFHAKDYGPATSGLDLVRGYALVALGCVGLLLGLSGVKASAVPTAAAYLGRISYGLYVLLPISSEVMTSVLLHVPLLLGRLRGVEATMALLLTIAIASVSYRYFETPLLKRRKKEQAAAA